MRFYFDLNLGKLVSLPSYSGLLSSAEFKRGDESVLEVQFCRGSVAQSLVGVVSEMVFVGKLDFLAGTEPLLLANDWTHDAVNHIYSAPLGQSEDLTTVLGTLAFKDLLGELTFTTSGGGPSTSQTIVARVTNDVWKGIEGTPLSMPTPEAWLIERQDAMLRTAAQGAPVSFPDTVTITGISDPADSDPIELVRADDSEGYPSWILLPWILQGQEGVLTLYNSNSEETLYVAEVTTVSLSPVGVVGWSISIGEGQPSIVGIGVTVAAFIGQWCRVGDVAPYDWYRWDGVVWQLEKQDAIIRAGAEGDPTGGPSSLVVTQDAGSPDFTGDYQFLVTSSITGANIYTSDGEALLGMGNFVVFKAADTGKWIIGWAIMNEDEAQPAFGDAHFRSTSIADNPWEVSGWYGYGDVSSLTGLVVAGNAGMLSSVPSHIGQYCRVGDFSPYDWYRWDGTEWELLPIVLPPPVVVMPPPAPSTESVLGLLQGWAEDPTRIGTEYLPDEFDGDKVFNGQVELGAQDPVGDTSAMNLIMTHRELMFSASCVRMIPAPAAYNNSGSGSAAISENNAWNLSGFSTANAWQRVTIMRNMTTNPSWTGGISNAAVPQAYAMVHFAQLAPVINHELRFVVGEVGAGAPIAYGSSRLAARGFGFVVYYSVANARYEVKLFAHNGTTYVESAAAAFIASEPSSWLHNTIISSDGAGTVKLFEGVNTVGNIGAKRPSSTPTLMLSGGPSSGNLGQAYVSALIVNGAVAPVGIASWRILHFLCHTGAVY